MTIHQIINLVFYNRLAIIKVTASTTILLFLILYFVYPMSFKANTSMLPPLNANEVGGLSGLLSGQDFSSLLTGGASNLNSQLYMEILKSRSAAEIVVKKHSLVKYYNVKNIQEASEKLIQNLEIDLSKEGIVTLNVNVTTKLFPLFMDDIDSMKNFSAAISNSYISALDSINRQKLTTKARKARKYIEQQIQETKVQLDSAEYRLMQFQKNNKTISLPDQVKASIDAAAKLKTQIVQYEVELGYLRNNLKENNQQILSLETKLNELNQQYSKLEVGNQDYLVTFSDVPDLGKELAGLLRDVKIQNEVYLLLQQQYYKEKIQENKDMPTVEILDKAIPPLKASGPRVLFTSVLGGVFSFLLMTLIFVVIEYRKTKR